MIQAFWRHLLTYRHVFQFPFLVWRCSAKGTLPFGLNKSKHCTFQRKQIESKIRLWKVSFVLHDTRLTECCQRFDCLLLSAVNWSLNGHVLSPLSPFWPSLSTVPTWTLQRFMYLQKLWGRKLVDLRDFPSAQFVRSCMSHLLISRQRASAVRNRRCQVLILKARPYSAWRSANTTSWLGLHLYTLNVRVRNLESRRDKQKIKLMADGMRFQQ